MAADTLVVGEVLVYVVAETLAELLIAEVAGDLYLNSMLDSLAENYELESFPSPELMELGLQKLLSKKAGDCEKLQENKVVTTLR